MRSRMTFRGGTTRRDPRLKGRENTRTLEGVRERTRNTVHEGSLDRSSAAAVLYVSSGSGWWSVEATTVAAFALLSLFCSRPTRTLFALQPLEERRGRAKERRTFFTEPCAFNCYFNENSPTARHCPWLSLLQRIPDIVAIFSPRFSSLAFFRSLPHRFTSTVAVRAGLRARARHARIGSFSRIFITL